MHWHSSRRVHILDPPLAASHFVLGKSFFTLSIYILTVRHALRLPKLGRSSGIRPIRVPATELPVPSPVVALNRLSLDV